MEEKIVEWFTFLQSITQLNKFNWFWLVLGYGPTGLLSIQLLFSSFLVQLFILLVFHYLTSL